jgi:hypothetical protein
MNAKEPMTPRIKDKGERTKFIGLGSEGRD